MGDGTEGTQLPFADRKAAAGTDAEALEYADACRSLIENLPDGFALCRVLFDEDGEPDDFICEEVNPACERQIGVRREELLGRRLSEVLPSIREDPWNWIERLGAVAATGEVLRVERFVPPLGRWFSIFAHRSSAGHFAILFNDITERVHAEQERAQIEREAHERAAHLDAIFAAMGEGVALYGPGHNILRLNARAKEMLALEAGVWNLPLEERARRIQYVLYPDGTVIPPADLPFSRALRGETVRGMLLRIETEKESRWISASAAPIRAPDGTVEFAVVTMTDVTALRELQEQRDDLLRTISHDLRTPLTALQLQAEMLRHGIEPGHPNSRRIDSVLLNAQRMNAMIGDLVELARLEAGQLALDLHTLDLGLFVEELKDRVDGALETRRVRVDVGGERLAIQADPGRLDRVLINLLSNALKYSPPDSEVLLSVARQGDRVCVLVEDHGRGIAPEELPHVFQRFYRSKSSSRHTEGLGLGLYISMLLVKAHGGDLTVQSELGKGSTFRVCLPIRGP